MIMPASVPIDAGRGPGRADPLPRRRLDAGDRGRRRRRRTRCRCSSTWQNPNLGRFSATRRVARTIYMGSAPTLDQTNKGIDDRTIKLGCVQPGESPATFGDALRRLANRATYLVEDNGSTGTPSARRSAARRPTARSRGSSRSTPTTRSGAGCSRRGSAASSPACTGRRAARPRSPTRRRRGSSCSAPTYRTAQATTRRRRGRWRRAILLERSGGPRLNRNALVFAAADADAARGAALGDALVPGVEVDLGREGGAQPRRAQPPAGPDPARQLRRDRQPAHQRDVRLGARAVAGQRLGRDHLGGDQGHRQPTRSRCASRRSSSGAELLITALGGVRLRMELDRVPLWQGDHVSTQQLWSYFAQYLYLPRLRDRSVLVRRDRERRRRHRLGAGHVRLRAGVRRGEPGATSGSSPGRARPC